MMMKSYNQRQEVNDRIAKNFSQYIRGVDEYKTPDGRPVELPSGYNHVYTNGQGEYVLSNEPGFNPNAYSNQNWTRLEK